ncbi:hypothetical protein SERLADRAFT_405890 [Serpula lacrymans var. lacrymans S7.9]|nr:uncharacterized protein SERLADRAFT_405890 [Serpula lacrymans var. lacrymans S7.9]EGO28287.1 hypothetical protein SERLADRAFT_405890 [Serpula lacrymans var. lacrymans S7.9]
MKLQERLHKMEREKGKDKEKMYNQVEEFVRISAQHLEAEKTAYQEELQRAFEARFSSRVQKQGEQSSQQVEARLIELGEANYSPSLSNGSLTSQIPSSREPSGVDNDEDDKIGLVQRVFKSKFTVDKDKDFAVHEPAATKDIITFNQGDGNASGPDGEDLHFDIKGNKNSEWNNKVIRILFKDLKEERVEWCLPDVPKSYLIDLINVKFNRVRTYWKLAQRQTKSDELKTWEEVENRLIKKPDERLSNTRKQEQWCNKFKRRQRTLTAVIEVKKHNGAPDIAVWKWLEELVNHLLELSRSKPGPC